MNTRDFVSQLGFRFCNTGNIGSEIYEDALQYYNGFSELCFVQNRSEMDFFFLAEILEGFCLEDNFELSYKDISYGMNLLLMQFFYITIIHYKDFRIGHFFLSKIKSNYHNADKYENFISFWNLQMPQILLQI